MTWLNIILAGMALLLSGIGLFNMVSLNVLKQRKAVGVRKVLGASKYNILINLSKSIIILLFISLLIGSIKGYFLTGMVLDLMYAFHSVPSISTMISSALAVLFILASIISYKVYQEASSNPVNALRYE
jgi:putative ABC transport system permease protein